MANTNYTTYNNFETGAIGHFDVDDDNSSGADFAHYTELARTPGLAMPYRGAYCYRIDLATASTDGAWLQETASWLCTINTEDIYIRVKFWLSPDAAMSSDDVFDLINLASGGDVTPHDDGTSEAGIQIKYTTAAGWTIGAGETGPTSTSPLALGQWHDVEMYADIADAAGGTIDWWLDGTAMTQVTGLTHANITSGAIGAFPNKVAAAFTPTAGTLLIDQVIASQTDNTSTRIGSGGPRFPKQVLLEAAPSGTTGHHVFIGHGVIDNISLLAGNDVDNVLQVWDTDTADTTNASMKLELRNLSALETPVDPAGVPIEFSKGCYVTLTGTTPRAIVNIHRAVGYYSDGAVRNAAYV